MKSILTNSKISFNINDDGVSLFIKSPEIINILESGKFAEKIWNTKIFNDRGFPQKSFFRFFSKKPEHRSILDIEGIDIDFIYCLFHVAIKDYCNYKLLKYFNYTLDGDMRWVYDHATQRVNLTPLICPLIYEGKNFHYSGVYIDTLFEKEVVSLLRFSAASFIRYYS